MSSVTDVVALSSSTPTKLASTMGMMSATAKSPVAETSLRSLILTSAIITSYFFSSFYGGDRL